MTAPARAPYDASYYETVYRNYSQQNPSYKIRFYHDLVLRHTANAPQKQLSILDVGCAFGVFLKSLPSNWKRFGIDISHHSIEKAAEGEKSISFAPAILENNPFRGPFDVVTSFDVIEHIPDRDHALDNFYDLLKPGGLFVFVVPVYDGPLGWLVHRLDRDPTHLHKVGRADWVEWAQRRFQVLEWGGAFRFLFPGGVYLHWPTRLMRSATPCIAVVARKPFK